MNTWQSILAICGCIWFFIFMYATQDKDLKKYDFWTLFLAVILFASLFTIVSAAGIYGIVCLLHNFSEATK